MLRGCGGEGRGGQGGNRAWAQGDEGLVGRQAGRQDEGRGGEGRIREKEGGA